MSWPIVMLLVIGALMACGVAIIQLLSLFFYERNHDAARDHAGAPQHSWHRALWFRWVPIIFITAFVGLFAIKGLRESFGVRDLLGNLKSQISDAQISDQDIEQLANEVLKRDEAEAEPIPVTVPRETTENLPPAEPELATPLDPESLKVTVFEPGADEGRQVSTLPGWTRQSNDAEALPRVISTTPHATVESAEAEAISLLAEQLAKQFAAEHPEAAGWTPPASIVQNSGVIARRAIQETDVAVGEFTEPVFQAYLEVVPPDTLEEQLLSAWRADTLGSRLLLVGGMMGLITLMFGSLAGYFRIDDATRGKYRNRLRLGTAALWVAAGSALAFIA